MLIVAAGLAAATGVGIGATALAAAATSPTTTKPSAPKSGVEGSTPSTPAPSTNTPGRSHGFGGRFAGPGYGAGGFGGGFCCPVLHGEYTVQGPNGYETIDERTGTVSAVSNTSGNTWSLSVKSADGTSGTFTVDSTTSVNGGESGIASVKTGDTVDVTGTVSSGTSTATEITDQTTLQANGKTWMPMRPTAPSGAGPVPGMPVAPAMA